MPLQNRVAPDGSLHEVAARGQFPSQLPRVVDSTDDGDSERVTGAASDPNVRWLFIVRTPLDETGGVLVEGLAVIGLLNRFPYRDDTSEASHLGVLRNAEGIASR